MQVYVNECVRMTLQGKSACRKKMLYVSIWYVLLCYNNGVSKNLVLFMVLYVALQLVNMCLPVFLCVCQQTIIGISATFVDNG